MRRAPALAAAGVMLLASGCGDGIEEVTPPAPFHGIHGMAFDQDNRLLAGSVLGQTIYEIRPNGDHRVLIGPPLGQADDLAVREDGLLAWTGFLDGKIYARQGEGEIRVLAEGLPGLNSLAFAPDGRLFATQVFLGDALYEIDLEGEKPARQIMKDMGGLNGFEFGADGHLYGPLWFKGQVVRVDVERARIEVIAEGFGIPAAVNFGPDGQLYAVDTQRGEVVRVDPQSGAKQVAARVKPAIDNLAFDRDGRLFISNMADNAIIEIDLEDGEAETLVSGVLAAPADIASAGDGGPIYIADVFAIRTLDPESGEVGEVARMFGDEMDYPLNVWAGPEHIVLTGWSAGSLQVIERGSGKSLALLHGLTTPHDAVMLPGGDILAAEFSRGRIVRLSGEKWERRRAFASGLSGPCALVLGPDGEKLYVAEHGAGRIIEIDVRTRKRRLLVQGLQGPEGFDRLADGRFVVAEAGAKRISIFGADGAAEVLAEDLPIGLPAAQGAIPPYATTGIAVVGDGVYFSSDLNAAIYRIDLP